ncbi:MAG: DUF5682 family protein [Planctomycetota bacterium]
MESTVDHVADQAGLDPQVIASQVEDVLSKELYWFPVRHHSAAVAHHLELAIHDRKPKLILIEGPSESNELIKFLIDGKTKPPVAIYSSFRDDDNTLGLAGIASPASDIPARFSCWYPMLSYSPEYVAMLAAKNVGAEVRFIDLPHHAMIKPADVSEPESGESVDEPASANPSAIEREDERIFIESGFYKTLARVAGYRTWDEAWDTLFEIGDWQDDYEAFRRELATFCAAVRATTNQNRIESDGTLERERFMSQTIARTLQETGLQPQDAMVVCGGFHLFLDENDTQSPPPTPDGTLYTTIVPYSFFRVSELSGYSAGNRAPQFYQLSWDLSRKDRFDDLLAEHVVAVLKRARRNGESLSSADAISVSQHARMLAQLRGRQTPVLDDIQDALITCCCKGDPLEEGVQLLKAIDAVNIGTKVGRVTPKLGRLPMVNDFYMQVDQLQLDEVTGKEKKLSLTLDKRDPSDERRSVFLHRLLFLQVPLGKQIGAPKSEFATGTLFKERWALKWNPKIEPSLVEQNLYGDTIESAVLARLNEQIADASGHAERTCEYLRKSIEMDLPTLVLDVQNACGEAIDTDSRFVSLASAIGHLNIVQRYADHRGLNIDALHDLIVRAFDRACYSIPGVSSVPEDQQSGVINALLLLADLLLKSDDDQFEKTVFAENVRSALSESSVPFLRGAFLGILAEIREIPAEELAAEVTAYASGSAEQMIFAGDFLDGAMSVSRTSIMLGAKAIVSAIDQLLRAADWETFLTMIPRMRAAFEKLHSAQADSLSGRVAQLYGLAEDEVELRKLQTSVGSAALMTRVDQKVVEIMERWSFK